MKILVIDGHTKEPSFIGGALTIVDSYLKGQGVETRQIKLRDQTILDCTGCFGCLKTGVCPLEDDMASISQAMIAADGFVIGSPVRNGHVTACYKRFYERITYPLGFTQQLRDKYTLAISAVGMMGGRSVNRDFLGLQSVFNTILSGYIFTKTGLPAKVKPAMIRAKLEKASARLVDDIERKRPRSLYKRLMIGIDDWVVRKMLLNKEPDRFAYVIEQLAERERRG